MPAKIGRRNTIVGGWQYFERWARRFCERCDQLPIVPILSTYLEVHMRFDYDADDETLYSEPFSRRERATRVSDQLGFMRGYFVDISFDQGDFARRVRHTLSNHNNRDWKRGYGFFFHTNDLENAPDGDSHHFSGTNANLFCDEFSDIDFASVMSVLPFDKILVRNHKGRHWTKPQVRKAIADIESDLAFDGMESDLSEDHVSGSCLFLYARRPFGKKKVGNLRSRKIAPGTK
jgi:hypothetical protein